MKHRPAFDGTHQERALRSLLSWSQRALRTRSGKTLRDLADELSIAPATLARYLNGTTPLSSEQFAPFARAFETTEAELIAACFPVVAASQPQQQDIVVPPGWTLREALRCAIPEGDIDGLVADWEHLPLENQFTAVPAILHAAHLARTARTRKAGRDQTA